MKRRTFMQFAGAAAGAAALPALAAAPAGAMSLERWQRMRRFVATPFGRIAVIEQGSGPAAALFLHGFPLSSFQWRDAVAALSAHRRCIAPDFMALGFTEPAPGQAVDADAQVIMLAHLLDTLHVRQVDVIANDSGGAVAQLLMVRHPERVRSLLLTNCDTEPDCPPPALLPVIDLSRKGRFVDEWLLPSVLDHRQARTKDGLGGQCYADPGSPTDDAIDAYLAPLTASPARKAFVHAYALALERNILRGIGPALRRAPQPVRVVWGTADGIFSTGTPAYLEQAFGNGRGVRRLDGYKLFWPEERPDVVVEEALTLWGVSAA
jgi:pimeloyl-ACP methyl ester carboxylesterase